MSGNEAKTNPDVTAFLDAQHHPLRNLIEQLRSCILLADDRLSENIKWQGPNYSVEGNDRITMKIQPPKSVQLVFHRGAKKQMPLIEKIIDDPSSLLAWKENDRAIATFKSAPEFEAHRSTLTHLIKKWITATI